MQRVGRYAIKQGAMVFNNIDWGFLLTVLGATVVKVASSPFHSITRALLMIFAAVFSAYVFTDPIVRYFSISFDYYLAVAALLTLTGEGLMRMLITFSSDPEKLIKVIQLWTNK